MTKAEGSTEAGSSAGRIGVVVAVRGSVVDVRFDAGLPAIYSILHAGPDAKIVIEVLTHRDPTHVRGIALTPTQGRDRTSTTRSADRVGAAWTAIQRPR